jgi:hypothetical protein
LCAHLLCFDFIVIDSGSESPKSPPQKQPAKNKQQKPLDENNSQDTAKTDFDKTLEDMLADNHIFQLINCMCVYFSFENL